MHRLPTRRAFASILALVAVAAAFAFTPATPDVQPNDNTKAAGRLSHDTLHLRLVVQMANWRPESDTGQVLSVAAFSEEGKAPQIPGPLIRVREGTTIASTVHNALTDSSITLIGLGSHTGKRDTVVLAPGESRSLTFKPGPPGTYLYRARIGTVGPTSERDQNGGAFVVDPVGGSPPDRIFVMNIWGDLLDSTTYNNALAINGRSWPWTERMKAVVGDTLRWRVVNATGRPHPMHLHGAYFRVDSKGHQFADTTYAPDQRRLVVTEDMAPRQTMSIVWSPVREGRWVFHCHITFHASGPEARLAQPAHAGHAAQPMDPATHMAGLILGIDATLPKGVAQAARLQPRRLDLYVQEGTKRTRAERSMSFILQRGPTPPRPDSMELPGSLLVLTRDQPTDVTVHNRLKDPTAVHWHGLELESFSDGVAHWGGSTAMPTPMVKAGDTFTARLTMPRAGTFMYHTHLSDAKQLSGGLYAPIVVLEPGKVFDAKTDHVHIVGWDVTTTGSLVLALFTGNYQLLVNGDSLAGPPIEMRVGEAHRFRFINIGMSDPADFTIKRDTVLAEWTPIAKDGADLPRAQRAPRKARLSIDVGQTYDFEFKPTAPGEYLLSTPTGPKDQKWVRKILVK